MPPRRRTPAEAEAAFWSRVAELGATPAPDAVYVDLKTPVALVCAAGHTCTPMPGGLVRGQGPCRTCVGRDPKVAAAAFWAKVAEHGAAPAPGAVYAGNKTPVPLTCAAGHTCTPRPHDVLRGHTPCRTCAGRDPRAAEAAFWSRVAELGAAPAPGAAYVDLKTPVPLVCAAGHPCTPMPGGLARGQGPCPACARVDRAAAEAQFHTRLAARGARLAPGAAYAGVGAPVAIVCAAGHTVTTRPGQLRAGRGHCRICSRRDTATAAAAFTAAVTAAGARLAPGAAYVNARTPVPLTCAAGHACAPKPNTVQQGGGLCGRCTVSFDRVYLLVHARAGAVKVGVAAIDHRVAEHTARGYRLVACWGGLAHDAAVAAERAVLGRWRAAGLEPVPGVPADGRTETASAVHLEGTRAQLEQLLGAPTETRDVAAALTVALLTAGARAA